MSNNPHRDQPVREAGKPLAKANGAVILLHGRGGSAENVLGMADEFERADLAYLAPAAAGHTWYPYSFLAPFEQNEPWLSSALLKIGATVEQAAAAGIPRDRIVVAGFSQGACLASEFIARQGAGLGGLVALTGGLIGPAGTKFNYSGSLANVRAFLGSGDPDVHVPWERVAESAAVLQALGAEVTARRYPGMPHTVSRDEIAQVQQLLAVVMPE